jgi:hypothetical protein
VLPLRPGPRNIILQQIAHGENDIGESSDEAPVVSTQTEKTLQAVYGRRLRPLLDGSFFARVDLQTTSGRDRMAEETNKITAKLEFRQAGIVLLCAQNAKYACQMSSVISPRL